MSLRLNQLARRCLRTGPEDKVYQVVKLAMVIDALAAEGISVEDALAGVGISRNATSSPATRVSLHQIIECYRNANKLTRSSRPFAISMTMQSIGVRVAAVHRLIAISGRPEDHCGPKDYWQAAGCRGHAMFAKGLGCEKTAFLHSEGH
jgi:hypothetical protein